MMADPPAPSPTKAIERESEAVCSLCEQECSLDERTRYTASRWCHKECKNNYNRQNERCRGSTRLKKWWDKLSKEEKSEWFQRNRGLDKNKRKTFDNMSYSEKHATKRYKKEDLIVDYIPFSQFKEDEEKSGRTDLEMIKQSWLAKLNDRTTKKKVRNQWCIAKFRGLRETIGKEDYQEQGWVRGKSLNDRDDCEDAAALSSDFNAEAVGYHDQLCNSHVSSFLSAAAPDFDEAEIRAGPPDVVVPLAELQMEIRRDILVDQKERVALQDLEEQDTFEAEQYAKTERDAKAMRRGRPKKTRGELLSEASRMLREKALHIELAADKAKASVEEVVADSESKASLPADVVTVKESCEKEIQKHVEAILNVVKVLREINVEELVTDGDSAQTRKSISEKCRTVYKEHLPAITRTCAAFRKSLKAAMLNHSRAGKVSTKEPSPAEKLLQAQEQSGVRKAMAKFITENVHVEKININLPPKDALVQLKPATGLVPDAALKELKELPGFAAHDKWLSRLLVKGDSGVHALSHYEATLGKPLAVLLEKHLPFVKAKAGLPADAAALKEQVFTPQHFAGLPGMVHIGVVPHGLSELRLLTWGCYVAIGAPMGTVAGATLKEKLATISTQAGGEKFVQECTTSGGSGWASMQTAIGSLLLVPAGHIVVFMGTSVGDLDVDDVDEQFRGIRVGTMSTDSRLHVDAASATLKELMQCFPELAETEYKSCQANIDGVIKAALSAQESG